MRTIGWPKMDHVDAAPEAFAARVSALRAELGLTGRPVVLLACSWADRRQLADTLAALGDEDVDLVVKYPPPSRWPDDSPWRERLAAAEAERCAALELARADPRVAAADRREDIMALVALADVVLANGSNVLYEGILAGAPGVSISDWAHPAGLHGEQTVPPFIDLPGVLTGRAGDIADLVRLALDPRLAPVVARSAGTLVEPGTRGVAAGRAADVIEDALRSRA